MCDDRQANSWFQELGVLPLLPCGDQRETQELEGPSNGQRSYQDTKQSAPIHLCEKGEQPQDPLTPLATVCSFTSTKNKSKRQQNHEPGPGPGAPEISDVSPAHWELQPLHHATGPDTVRASPGLPWRLRGKESACWCMRPGFLPWSRGPTCLGARHAPQLLSLGPRVLEPALSTREATIWEAHAPQRESSPCFLQPEKSPRSNEAPAQPKINKLTKL